MPFLKPSAFSVINARIENCKRNGLRHKIFSAGWPLKNCYAGEWRNDKKEGKGSELSKHNWLYEGDWCRGLRHGYGVLSKVLKDGTIWKCYAGNWVKGKKQGFGGYWYLDGSYYEGNFWRGTRHGLGRMWYADGKFYQGLWGNDLHHGDGMLVQADGNRYEGQFFRDKKEGRGIFYHLDCGQLQEGCWENDVCVTSTMEDIYWRQTAPRSSFYPIPEDELVGRNEVIEEREEQVLGPHRDEWECYPPVSEKSFTFAAVPC